MKKNYFYIETGIDVNKHMPYFMLPVSYHTRKIEPVNSKDLRRTVIRQVRFWLGKRYLELNFGTDYFQQLGL